MRIQHNITAMNSYRNYMNNSNALSKNLEKLSSGYKINRAGDDAAGLAISEKMRAQISGLEQATNNVKDGISLVKTAEGALQEVQDMLNRMVTLATQSANGTYQDDVDRENLQSEVDALKDEINRIAESSNFNGQKLLNGELDSNATLSTTAAGTAAINTKATEIQDGATASAATKAKSEQLTVAAGHTNLIGKKVEDLTVGGVKLEDLFTVTATIADTTNGQIAAGDKIKLEAKTAGALSDSVINDLKALGFEITNGTDTGSGTAATKASYDLEFDFTKISGGDTFSLNGKTFQFVTDGSTLTNGNVAIDISGLDLTAAGGANTEGQYAAATKIQAALASAFGGSSGSYDVDVAPTTAPAGDKYSITLTAKNAGGEGNNGQIRDVQSTTGGVTGTYNKGAETGVAVAGQFAKVSYDVELTKLAVGDKITLGTGSDMVTIEIVEDSKVDANNGKISLSDAKTASKLAQAFETAGYKAGKVEIANGKLTITGTAAADANKASTFAAGDAKLGFTPKTTPAAATATKGSALTLQIGDTADNFNKLKMEISDMHVKALGIDTISVADQASAAGAIDAIKAAINTVSSTRGDLGAIQNRLEHTQNNLSTMTENIQDAESTIRDTDIADEMTAYTKNNILLQSAQAMLAQANQMPQGVLQLLQ